MADTRPPLPSQNSGSSIAGHHVQLTDSAPPSFPESGLSNPFDSQVHLASEGGQDYDDEYLEKQPLTDGHTFAGGFYPPAYVQKSAPLFCLIR